jgi:flavin reductase (DIM6/NTAB) family NADH-FMN oxidoreductase RutF
VIESTTPFDRDVFRDVIGHFTTGVTIVTVRHEARNYGVTVSAVSSLSLEPPMLLVCLNRSSRTQGAIGLARSFAVNILSHDQAELARRFATGRDDKFEGIPLQRGGLGHPLLEGALAHVECRITEEAVGGTHTVFLAEVEWAERFEGSPLVYFRGQFGWLGLEDAP